MKRKESTKAAACVSCWSTPKHEREGVEYVVVRYIRRDDVYGCRLFRRGCNKTRKTLISDDRLRWFSLTVLAEQRRDNNEKIAHPLSLFDCFPLNSIVRLCLITFSMTLKKERKKKTPNFSNNTFAFQSIPWTTNKTIPNTATLLKFFWTCFDRFCLFVFLLQSKYGLTSLQLEERIK